MMVDGCTGEWWWVVWAAVVAAAVAITVAVTAIVAAVAAAAVVVAAVAAAVAAAAADCVCVVFVVAGEGKDIFSGLLRRPHKIARFYLLNS